MAMARWLFPVPVPPDEDDIVLIGDEGAIREFSDQGLFDRRVGEVEIVDVLGERVDHRRSRLPRPVGKRFKPTLDILTDRLAVDASLPCDRRHRQTLSMQIEDI